METTKFTYNGFHGFSYHMLKIKPEQHVRIDGQDFIKLTPAQIRKHTICDSKECKCGEGIGFWLDYNVCVLRHVRDGVMKGNYPQS